MRKKVFISKVFQMSFVMFVLNISNMCFNIFISKISGAENTGVFHQLISVYSFASVVSVSGITLTTTRLISDMPPHIASIQADNVVIKCIKISMIPACTMFFFLYFGSEFLTDTILGIPNVGICFKILAPTLIFSVISSVIQGYFTSLGMVGSISMGRFCSESGAWIACIIFIKLIKPTERYLIPVYAYATGSLTEMISLYILWIRKRVKSTNESLQYSKILRLCTPIAIGAYLRCGLTSAENIIIPRALRSFGRKNPMADYGIIKGMTMPVIMFPMVFVGAFTSLIVPEIARKRCLKHSNGIKYISVLSIEYVLKFSLIVSAILFIWHKDLARMFFEENDVSKYLSMLAALPVFLFTDSITDALLKGMDEQISMLKINTVDSVCRVITIIFLMPKFGIITYIIMLYVSEILNLIASYHRLNQKCSLSFPLFSGIIIPLISLLVAYTVINALMLNYLWVKIIIFIFIYVILNCAAAMLTSHKRTL